MDTLWWQKRAIKCWLTAEPRQACLPFVYSFVYFWCWFQYWFALFGRRKNQPRNRRAKNSVRYIRKFLLFSTVKVNGWWTLADKRPSLTWPWPPFESNSLKLSSHCDSVDCRPAQILFNFVLIFSPSASLLSSAWARQKKKINILSAGCRQPRRKS